MIAQTQMKLINSSRTKLTIKEALALCEKIPKIYYAGKIYEATVKVYQYKEIEGIRWKI